MFMTHALLALLVFSQHGQTSNEANNYCADALQWQKWQQLTKKFPDDDQLAAAYGLRMGLCEQIRRGEIENDRAIEIFDRYFTAMKETTQEKDRQEQTEKSDEGQAI